MAKVAFTKLGLKTNQDKKVIQFNGQEIEIEQYLPVSKKLEVIGEIINNCAEDQKYYNIGKFEVYSAIAIIEAYTNINFTDKQKEDVCKLYDLFISSELYNTITDAIPMGEIDFILNVAMGCIQSIYTYTNSALGILDAIGTDYSNLDLDATELQKKIGDPENLALLKSIMTKLG